MLVDIPDHTVQMINQQAEMRGVSMVQLLNQTFGEPDLFLNSDLTEIKLSAEDAKKLQEILDRPPVFNKKLQELLALTKDM